MGCWSPRPPLTTPSESVVEMDRQQPQSAVTPPPVKPDTQGLGGLGWKPRNVKLRSLTLDNFKSFQRKTTIPFGEGFTAVSGPNGSGKSNLIDAILFVLGFVRGAKGLRADRLTDLICSDSDKPFARVALEFEGQDEKDQTRTFEVARVVRRTRTGQDAHYEVDGSAVRLSDLHDLLRDLGLSSSGWNVVLQGDVTALTLMGPVPRRQILDEIAGAREFDRRIGAANEELSSADRHVADTKIILKEIEERLLALAKERETALAYQALREQRAALDAELLVLEVMDAELQADRKSAEAIARKEQAEGGAEELVELEKERDEVKVRLDAIEGEIHAKGEGTRLEALKQVEVLKAAKTRAAERGVEARDERASLE
jgi:chromosome segregation protein